tara:strand:+ start:452 stop:706 length:255 start_codon:yes stop_codon:yes gene_type:complete
MAEEQKQPELINFDGEQYLISDLTPELALKFNMLIRINREVEDAAYVLQRTQASQSFYIKDIKKGLVDEDIKPLPPEETKTEDE